MKLFGSSFRFFQVANIQLQYLNSSKKWVIPRQSYTQKFLKLHFILIRNYNGSTVT